MNSGSTHTPWHRPRDAQVSNIPGTTECCITPPGGAHTSHGCLGCLHVDGADDFVRASQFQATRTSQRTPRVPVHCLSPGLRTKLAELADFSDRGFCLCWRQMWLLRYEAYWRTSSYVWTQTGSNG
ncbi:hypothetical protein PG985_013552 [Apiospora marii]|uniref:Uncharacterized protein n=1 Tax=Apiospora marii TaxID=335849 RepID=A0ABR1R7N6_9PEZI